MICLFDDLSLSRPWEGVLREEEGEEEGEEEEEGLFKANTEEEEEDGVNVRIFRLKAFNFWTLGQPQQQQPLQS